MRVALECGDLRSTAFGDRHTIDPRVAEDDAAADVRHMLVDAMAMSSTVRIHRLRFASRIFYCDDVNKYSADEAPELDSAVLKVFIHTPRTGGTTITRLLAQKYRLLHLNPAQQIAAFLTAPNALLASADVAVGHMPFGLERFTSAVEYSVFVREPVDRFVSTWRYVRSVPSHPNFAEVQAMTLLDYLNCTITFMNDNGMVRRMATYDWSEVLRGEPYWWQRVPHGRVTRLMLDQAKENLRRCAFVGMFERYERDAKALLNRFGIEGTIPRVNASEGTFAASPEERAAIAARHELDAELYAFARTLTP